MKITEQPWPAGTVPLVSISCITYNHANYIREAIEGFLMQKTTFPVEILIHDDASADGTKEIIKEYASKYPQLIRCFYEAENTWHKPNRRKIWQPFIDARRGKYIALCEGDDYWTDPLKLQKQVEFLETNEEYVMCFHRSKVICPIEFKYRANLYNHIETRMYSGEEIYREWTIPTASVLYKKEVAYPGDAVFRQPGILFGDIILFLKLSVAGKIYGMAESMAVYRVHPQGISSIKDPNFDARFIQHHKIIARLFHARYRHISYDIIARTYQRMLRNPRQKQSRLTKFFLKTKVLQYKILRWFFTRYRSI